MDSLPGYISFVFILTTFLTIYFFYRSCLASKTAIWVVLGWTIVQGVIGWSGFYTVTDTVPPRFILLFMPTLVVMGLLFFTSRGRRFIDDIDLRALTILHIVRIPVELVLFWLFVHQTVPQSMTFEGRNFDILSGISAPFIYYFVFVKNTLPKKFLMWWNLICLLLLFNIVFLAFLSAPFPFQQYAFDQPNTAVLYFPYIWLPGVVVPLVLFSHLVVIRRLLAQSAIRG